MPVDKITHQSGFSQRTERHAWLRLNGAQQGSRGCIQLKRLHVAIKNRIGLSPETGLPNRRRLPQLGIRPLGR
jgi:hypothetical protein